jgi:hypothetical protein
LFPLPLKPIKVEKHFQQWGLDFIGDINPNSSGKHKWILAATDYFTKWVDAIPTRAPTDTIIIMFLEENILVRFGCPRKIIIDNVQSFKSTKLVKFCQDYNIELGHSTALHYPHGNGLAKSSNKKLIKIIKKMLNQNKKAWDSHLKYDVWENKFNIKRAIGTFPFQLVYGLESIFTIQCSLPVMKLLQDEEEKSYDMQRRINQLIEFQQVREQVQIKSHDHQARIKEIFDKRTKETNFMIGDLVLKWYARREAKGKHGKFDNIWLGPFQVVAVQEKNTYDLSQLDGELFVDPVNGRFLKHFLQY